jgi:hypothetical protein
MAEITCPICGRSNDANAERCWYCQAVLPHDTPPASDDSQDWLDELRSEKPSTGKSKPQPDKSVPQKPPEAEVPGWLARIRLREQVERKGKSVDSGTSSSSTAPESVIPDWLSEINNEPKDKPGVSAPPKSSGGSPKSGQSQKEEPDDWVKKLESWRSDTNESGNPFQEEIPEELPAEPDLPKSKKPTDLSSAESSSDEDSEANWFTTFMQESADDQPLKKNSAPQQRSPRGSGKAETGSLAKKPSATTGSESTGEKPVATSVPEEENWLTSFKGIKPDQSLSEQVIPPAQKDSKTKAPFKTTKLTDWIQPKKSTSSSNEIPPEDEANIKLEPAILPDWLEELSPKPKEVVHPRKEEPPLDAEESGPLAGIEGTLQGEELSYLYTRPQTYSSSLTVTESQENRLQVLKNIADQARWEDEGLAQKSVSRAWILRLVVILLMFAAVLIPVIAVKIPAITPSLYPNEVIQTFNAVNALPVNKPVLIAADFDGSLYGELNWSLSPLLAHLMAKNIPLAFLSTNSVGAALFTQSLAPLVSRYSAYTSPTQLVDLGYLAGGSIGLQSLARNPAATLPLNSSLQPAWQTQPLSSIHELSDFGALIVVTENADTARYWIEQVKPALGSTPMLVVISAQSAPLLQPYFDSGQINGYLSGLNSAAAYETLTKDPQNANALLSTFQVTMLLAVLLVLVGGVVSLTLYRPVVEEKRGKSA